MTDPLPRQGAARAPAYRWLAAVPGLLLLGGVPFANRVEPYVCGLPLLPAWIVACILLTAAVMFGIGALDRGRARHR